MGGETDSEAGTALAGRGSASQRESTSSAPALSSGRLPLPHFGEWMQLGQPDSHGQRSRSSRTLPSSAGSAPKPRRAIPTPPTWPS